MVKRPELVNNEIYHISSRTVGDTVIFATRDDCYRGVYSLYEFNDDKPVEIWAKRQSRLNFKKRQFMLQKLGRPTSQFPDERNKLVEVLAFSLMPNHFHIIVKQLQDQGIVTFIKKVSGGFAKYFNEKYNRKGHLFNKFYPVHVQDEGQLRNVFTYVHTNAISLIERGWKEKGIKNPKKVRIFLEKYKWHSYPDYLGQKNFPSVTDRDFLLQVMGGIEGCRADVENWIMHKNAVKDFHDIFS